MPKSNPLQSYLLCGGEGPSCWAALHKEYSHPILSPSHPTHNRETSCYCYPCPVSKANRATEQQTKLGHCVHLSTQCSSCSTCGALFVLLDEHQQTPPCALCIASNPRASATVFPYVISTTVCFVLKKKNVFVYIYSEEKYLNIFWKFS